MNIEEYFRINGTYSINNELIDVIGHIELIKNVNKLPFKFGKVSGYFSCSYNQLKSLEGCPSQVGGDFYCSYNNQLTNLEGCPFHVNGNFYCSSNNLKSLEGSPNYVGGNFNCYNNELKSLEGCPKEIKGIFYCDKNLHDTNEYLRYLIIKKLTM